MKRVQRWPAASVVVLVGLSVAACGSPQTKRTATEAGVRSAKVSGEEPIPRVEPLRPANARAYTVLGRTYFPMTDFAPYREIGLASWYGRQFHGQPTATGETYDMYSFTAAHKTLPIPSYARVTNLANGKSVTVRVNDRGPFYSDRIIDLSFAAAKKLGYAESGTARVKVEGIDPHEWWAAQGRPVPMVLAQPKMANQPAPAVAQPVAVAASQPIEQYTPPPEQHAAAVVPVQMDVKKNASPAASGLYLQVAAFANPDAAELLKAKLSETVPAKVFISSVVRNQQILHRVRLGPVETQAEAQQLQDSVRLANLGEPALVKAD